MASRRLSTASPTERVALRIEHVPRTKAGRPASYIIHRQKPMEDVTMDSFPIANTKSLID